MSFKDSVKKTASKTLPHSKNQIDDFHKTYFGLHGEMMEIIKNSKDPELIKVYEKYTIMMKEASSVMYDMFKSFSAQTKSALEHLQEQ